MKYVIYAAVALLIAWAVWYVCRHLLRQVRGKGDCGCGCARAGTVQCNRNKSCCSRPEP